MSVFTLQTIVFICHMINLVITCGHVTHILYIYILSRTVTVLS